MPTHPFDGYRTEAAVDRVRIELRLAKPTQAHALRRHLPPAWGQPYVQAVGCDPSLTDTMFELWVQDPPGPDAMAADLLLLQERFDLAEPVRITGVETAIDFYPTGEGAHLSLEELVLHLIRNQATPPSGDALITWREYLPSGTVKPRFMSAAHPREVLASLAAGYTVQVGDLGSLDRARHYVKRHDLVGEDAYKPLPVEQHRARTERTLLGDRCPFSSLDEWRQFKFDTMVPLFKLRERPTSSTDKLPGLAGWQSSGRPISESKRRRHERMSPRGSRADQRSYDVVRGALRRLTTAQRASRPAPQLI